MAVSIGSITSANASFTLSVAGLFTAPQQIQQFGVDDAFDSEPVENGEIQKGVDNFIAAGWKPTMPKLNVTLMANSPSNAIFDQWFQYEQQYMTKLVAQGVISVPGIFTQYALLNAYLFGYMHLAPAKTTLKERKFILICDDISAAPMVGG
jgi:hypothetical protein